MRPGIAQISPKRLLKRMEWVSLGGGIYFTKDGYPLEKFCRVLKNFSESYGVQVYLEPGEAAVTCSTELVTTILDVVHNEVDIAIVDASVEAHMLDHLIYRTNPKISSPGPGTHPIMIAGRTCLAVLSVTVRAAPAVNRFASTTADGGRHLTPQVASVRAAGGEWISESVSYICGALPLS